MEKATEAIKRVGTPGSQEWQSVPPTRPSSSANEPPCGPTAKSTPDHDGCICDGSGWIWQDSTTLHQAGAMVRCPACQAAGFQARLAKQCGLLPAELALTLDDVAENGPGTAAMLSMAREFCREPWGMWTLWGGYGNAKTLILQAVVNHFRRLGRQSVYCRFKDLLDWIRAGNAPQAGQDAQDRYRSLVEVEVLAIDEIDKARLTEYADEFRSNFLDDRWRYGVAGERHTLLALNHDPAELPGHLYDRLRDGRFGCWLNHDGADVWWSGITRNLDASMRPAMERPR